MAAQQHKLEQYGIILLAAGRSARLGQPKQLLPYAGKTLLQHSIDAALQSRAAQVALVLGAGADQLREELPKGISVLVNKHWEEGMAASIRCGVHHYARLAGIEGLVLMVCDQPFISPEVINQLIAEQLRSGKAIVASAYADTIGPPVCFHRSVFPALLQVAGDSGAKALLRQFAHLLTTIDFAAGAFDIDTQQDYEQLVKTYSL